MPTYRDLFPHPATPAHAGAAGSGPFTGYDVLVVGAGFAGSVLAERLASQNGQRVLVAKASATMAVVAQR